jgi:uncharacterized membrane protein
MNKYKILNTIALAIPFLIGLVALFEMQYITFAIMSTMITGFIQVLLGIAMLISNRKNKKIQFYLITVFVFFLLWYLNTEIRFGYNDYLTTILFPIPLILAIYLSTIIYKTK